MTSLLLRDKREDATLIKDSRCLSFDILSFFSRSFSTSSFFHFVIVFIYTLLLSRSATLLFFLLSNNFSFFLLSRLAADIFFCFTTKSFRGLLDGIFFLPLLLTFFPFRFIQSLFPLTRIESRGRRNGRKRISIKRRGPSWK